MDISNLGFTERTETILRRGGIDNTEDLLYATDVELLQMRNMGQRSLAEIRSKIPADMVEMIRADRTFTSHSECCTIRDDLIKEFEDEITANTKYGEIAARLRQQRFPKLADIINEVSLDEFRHYVILHGLAEILLEECRCK